VLYRPGFAAEAAWQKSLRGTGRHGSRQGLPPGVKACPDVSGVFANAIINKVTS